MKEVPKIDLFEAFDLILKYKNLSRRTLEEYLDEKHDLERMYSDLIKKAQSFRDSERSAVGGERIIWRGIDGK